MALEQGSVKVAAVGDIFPGDHYFTMGHGVMSRTAAGRCASLFASVTSTLAQADIVIGNLEGPLSHTTDQRSSPARSSFRGLPEFAATLRAAGFSHLNIANNHIMQHGDAAFEATVDALRAALLKAVGISGAQSGCISEPVIESVRGQSVCLVGYSQVTERYSKAPRYAYFQDSRAVIAEVKWLARQYDRVLVSCHAGEEGVATPAPALVALYRAFADAGARCVLGHHSHVFQPVETAPRCVIAYSLGNFVFDLFWDLNTLESAVLLVDIDAARSSASLQSTKFSRAYEVVCSEQRGHAAFMERLDAANARIAQTDDLEYGTMLTAYERQNQKDKHLFFVRNLLRGATGKKLSFLLRKIVGRL